MAQLNTPTSVTFVVEKRNPPYLMAERMVNTNVHDRFVYTKLIVYSFRCIIPSFIKVDHCYHYIYQVQVLVACYPPDVFMCMNSKMRSLLLEVG